MKNDFSIKIRELREKHFTGQSLRNVSLSLEKDCGKNFFTYLSKIENGTLPSPELLVKIVISYELSQTEIEELFEIYTREKIKGEIGPSVKKFNMDLEKSPVLFRKSKKKNES